MYPITDPKIQNMEKADTATREIHGIFMCTRECNILVHKCNDQ